MIARFGTKNHHSTFPRAIEASSILIELKPFQGEEKAGKFVTVELDYWLTNFPCSVAAVVAAWPRSVLSWLSWIEDQFEKVHFHHEESSVSTMRHFDSCG